MMERIKSILRFIPEALWVALIAFLSGAIANAGLLRKIQLGYDLNLQWYYYIIISLLLIIICLIIVIRFKKHEISIYRRCEEKFESVAEHNATVDSKIFRALFMDISRIISRNAKIVSSIKDEHLLTPLINKVEQAKDLVETEITDALNDTVDLMALFSGTKCCISVKLYSGRQVKHNNKGVESEVDILYVAYTSDGFNRSKKINQTDDETPFDAISNNGVQYFMSGNLRRIKKYFDTDYESNPTYRAIIVVPIRTFVKSETEDNLVGYLQVDSLHGRIANETCRHYTAELSWRIAVMLRRFSDVRAELQNYRELGKTS